MYIASSHILLCRICSIILSYDKAWWYDSSVWPGRSRSEFEDDQMSLCHILYCLPFSPTLLIHTSLKWRSFFLLSIGQNNNNNKDNNNNIFCFSLIIHFNLHNCKVGLLPPFYRWENWDKEKLLCLVSLCIKCWSQVLTRLSELWVYLPHKHTILPLKFWRESEKFHIILLLREPG